MSKIFETRHKLVNREMKRAADREAERYVDRFLSIEDEFIDLLFNSEYKYAVLERWVSFTFKIRRWSMLSDPKVVHLRPCDIYFDHLKSEEKECVETFFVKINSRIREILNNNQK